MARQIYRDLNQALNLTPPDIAGAADHTIAGPGGPLALRAYTPAGASGALPVLCSTCTAAVGSSATWKRTTKSAAGCAMGYTASSSHSTTAARPNTRSLQRWTTPKRRWPGWRSLPPTWVATMGHDPLRDEGHALARQIAAAGVPVQHQHWPEGIHACLHFTALAPLGLEVLDVLAAWLRTRLA